MGESRRKQREVNQGGIKSKRRRGRRKRRRRRRKGSLKRRAELQSVGCHMTGSSCKLQEKTAGVRTRARIAETRMIRGSLYSDRNDWNCATSTATVVCE
jgi:hypothetical protein